MGNRKGLADMELEVRFPAWCDTPQRKQIYGLIEYDWHRMTWVHVPTKLSNWKRKDLLLEVERAIVIAQVARQQAEERSPIYHNVKKPSEGEVRGYGDKANERYPSEGIKESIEKCFGPEFPRDPNSPAGPKSRDDSSPVTREFRGRAIAENLVAAIAVGEMVNLPQHYAKWNIEPVRFLTENNIPWCEANCIKYLMRWRDKNGREDLMKVLSYANLIIARQDGDPEWWTINRRKPITFTAPREPERWDAARASIIARRTPSAP